MDGWLEFGVLCYLYDDVVCVAVEDRCIFIPRTQTTDMRLETSTSDSNTLYNYFTTSVFQLYLMKHMF